jgi:hypothetical protein
MKWEMQGMAAIEFHDATTPPKVFKGVNIFQARRNLLNKRGVNFEIMLLH